jgi:very-short-patch-repair endonuclease
MNYQSSKELVEFLLAKRAGPFSPLKKIFGPYLKFLQKETGVEKIDEIIYNARNGIFGPGKCEICRKPTKLYPQRGGWAKFCGRQCMNSASSSRYKKAELTKLERGTGIGDPAIRDKSKNTLIKKYGSDNPSSIEAFKEKRNETFIERFGTNTPWKNDDIKRKIHLKMYDLYGGTGFASKEILSTILKTKLEKEKEKLIARAKDANLECLNIDEYAGCFHYLKWRCACGTIFDASPYDGNKRLQNSLNKCPKCFPPFISQPQGKINDLLTSLGVKFLQNDRTIITPLELDIVIPDKKLAIEIDGLFFHGELSGKPNDYHFKKTLLVESLGFQLLHFTDFEISQKWNAVKNTIIAKLGLMEKKDARKLDIRSVDASTAKLFENEYHLQGHAKSSFRLGLFDKDELVALMTFTKSRFDKQIDYELLRFCSKYQVRGGASRLLTYFRRRNPGSIVSYADKRWSQGKMYEALGFKYIGTSKPGYWYFKNDEFHHRSIFKKHLICDDTNKHLTEWEIMQKSGWDRYWDCGHKKFILA